MENFISGANLDTREVEEKAKDWTKDSVMAGVMNWQIKTFDDVYKFPVRNQNGSGSCVMQTCNLMCGIENFLEEGKFIEFSADLYNFRSNPTPGMIGVEALGLLKEKGLTLEVLIPSMNMGEAQMATLKRSVSDNEIAKIFTIKDYYQIPFNVDAIATIMEMNKKDGAKKPLMVWFQFPRIEWDSKPNLTSSTSDLVRHSVTARDYGIVDGKKGIFIQDSWGLHSSTLNGLRFISEDYLKARMIFCAYVNDKDNDWQDGFTFTRTLRIGMKGEDVVQLQKILGITQDGYFGNQTKIAVKLFQARNGLLMDGIVGKLTIAKLNE